MNCQATLDLIRSLIPYVRCIRDNNPCFPEAFCDVTTAQIYLNKMVPGVKPRCGKVNGHWHLWVQFGEMNIDFTASQFLSLRPHVANIDGFDVLFGSDEYFASVGITILPEALCQEQLMNASTSIMMGEFGDLG